MGSSQPSSKPLQKEESNYENQIGINAPPAQAQSVEQFKQIHLESITPQQKNTYGQVEGLMQLKREQRMNSKQGSMRNRVKSKLREEKVNIKTQGVSSSSNSNVIAAAYKMPNDEQASYQFGRNNYSNNHHGNSANIKQAMVFRMDNGIEQEDELQEVRL